MNLKHFLFFLAAIIIPAGAYAQAMYFDSARVGGEPSAADTVETVVAGAVAPDNAVSDTVRPEPVLLTDYSTVEEYMAAARNGAYATVVSLQPLPRTFFMPAVFPGFEYSDSVNVFTPDYSGDESMRWIEESEAQARRMDRMNRYLYYLNPQAVPYNINLLPEAPKRYQAVVNPEEHTIEIEELPTVGAAVATIGAAPVRKRHWIQAFNASLQFSQAYVSPNWYQGGNSNINALANIFYNVKLNQEYHPNLLFETTAQYKLGLNNAPDDSIHNYNVSDDLFQLTSTFGVKAARRWYYSLSLLFKTQVVNSFKSNSHELRSAFMSPGELNVGLGMTYNYENPAKTIKFDASISPLSYNLKTCINTDIDPTQYDIDPGKKIKHKFGSSAELKFFWKICYNISYSSRLFAFTDYSNAYADWENTVNFDINRFLSTQIYVHARYDTSTPRCDDPGWHKLQVKEILSIGFAYKFSSI